MKYRVLESKGHGRVAVKIENAQDDQFVDVAIEYSEDCGDKIVEVCDPIMNPTPRIVIESPVLKNVKVLILAKDVYERFGLERDK